MEKWFDNKDKRHKKIYHDDDLKDYKTKSESIPLYYYFKKYWYWVVIIVLLILYFLK